MFRLALFMIFQVIVLGHDLSNDKMFIKFNKYCGALFSEGGLGCCIMDFHQRTESNRKQIKKECLELAHEPPPSCDLQNCMAVKLDIGLPNGTLDKSKLTEMMDEDMAGSQEIITAIKDNCINDDISKYGPEFECNLKKWELCIQIQLIGHCPKWVNEGPCKGVKETAAECYLNFP